MTKIAVIGGGFAGLSAAYMLKERDITVYEARDCVGGRVQSVPYAGHTAELGGQNISDGGSSPNIFRLVKELNLEVEERPATIHIKYHHHDGWHTIPKLAVKEAKGASVADRLAQLLDPHTGEYEAVCRLIHGWEGASPDKLSGEMYNDTLTHSLSGGISSVHPELSFTHQSIVGGNQRLAHKMAERVNVRLNSPLKRIEKQGTQYALTFPNEKTLFDKVIFAMPPTVYHDIDFCGTIEEGRLNEIQSIELGDNFKVIVPLNSGGFESFAIANERFVTFRSTEGSLLNIFYCGKAPKFPDDLILLSDHYDIGGEKPLTYNFADDPYIRGSYSFVKPGQEKMFTELEGDCKKLFSPIDNSLFFAGEHTCTNFDIMGTMEAAICSGLSIAQKQIVW
ncbi:MAG: FAD-dependent oxidoreductase [Simkaniaceae bacterium]|nr:FAD-dependent oxidoreductase [Simkaniaceae bacterium]